MNEAIKNAAKIMEDHFNTSLEKVECTILDSTVSIIPVWKLVREDEDIDGSITWPYFQKWLFQYKNITITCSGSQNRYKTITGYKVK